MSAVLLSTAWRGPEEIRRGAAYTAYLTLSRSGAVVAITAATVRVLDESGTVIVSGSAALAGGVASFAIDASATTSVDPVMGWTVEWTATTSYGADIYRNVADVVLYTVAPVLTWDILLGAHSDLGTRLATGSDLSTAKSRGQTKIEEAWYPLCQSLRKKGRRPCLVVDSYALLEAHKLATLRDIFRDLASGAEPNTTPEWALYEEYKAAAEREWDSLTFTEADPSTWQSSGIRKSTRGSMWLGSSGATPFRRNDGRSLNGGGFS